MNDMPFIVASEWLTERMDERSELSGYKERRLKIPGTLS